MLFFLYRIGSNLSAVHFPAGATRFTPAFKAGARAQTKSPSGLFEKL